MRLSDFSELSIRDTNLLHENINNAYDAYRYCWILGRRVPELEPLILKGPWWSYRYAQVVLSKRWPIAEPVILDYPKAAYGYARDVIRGRWPAFEQKYLPNLNKQVDLDDIDDEFGNDEFVQKYLETFINK